MAKIYLIRHAESVANTMGIYQGQTYDTDLSQLGKKQAQALANLFEQINFHKVYSSPLRRTKQTAGSISGVKGLPLELDINLIETNHGEWEGLSKDEIKAKYNGMYEGWLTEPGRSVFPQGESFSETVARSEAFLNSTIFDEDVVVVTHDNIIRAILSLVEEKDINKMWEYNLDPAGVTEIEVDYTNQENLYKVCTINNIEHLGNIRADITKHAL